VVSGQGADELRIKSLLVRNGVGPDAEPGPAIPPKPTERPRDWLDDILDTSADTPAGPAQKQNKPQVSEAKPPKLKKSKQAKSPSGKAEPANDSTWSSAAAEKAKSTVTARLPKGKLLNKQAVARTAYWASAAGVGWSIGIGPWFLACLNYYLGSGFYGMAVLVVIALIVLAVDSGTHALRGPGRHAFARAAGWMTRIPLATALLAIALYKTR